MEEKREYCVYKHTSKIDGRVYVGITRVGAEIWFLSAVWERKTSTETTFGNMQIDAPFGLSFL